MGLLDGVFVSMRTYPDGAVDVHFPGAVFETEDLLVSDGRTEFEAGLDSLKLYLLKHRQERQDVRRKRT